MESMNLLSSLLSGFPAAANGTAEIYIRDTSTRATYYLDFEASTTISSGADVTLDAYGSAEVYVNQLVDVVAKDEDGNTVKSYTDGYSSPNIEVVSPAFTGIDYVTAASAVNEPTTLQAVLNLWETNNGAPDWKVLIGGVATTVENAFGATAGLLFNVKSPLYGAVGDGVTNDQTAISAALAAAVAAGGGTVFFPKGTYLVTTAIEWDHRVSLVGVGVDLSTITTNSPSNARIITWTAGTLQSMPLLVKGLSFESTQANTGSELYATVAVNLLIQDCYFGSSANPTGTLLSFSGASSYVQIQRCRFDLNGASNTSLAFASTTKFVVENCNFVATNTSWGASMLALTGRGFVKSCIFDVRLVTGATTTVGLENLAASDRIQIFGCSFPQSAQPFDNCFKFVAASYIIVDGCEFDVTSSSTTDYFYSVTGILENGSRLQDIGVQRGSSSVAPTLRDGFGLFEMNSSTTAPTMTGPTMLYPGQTQRWILRNGSGANWAAIGFGVNVAEIIGSTAVNDTLTCCIDMVVADPLVANTYSWYAVFFQVG
jgi:hypothetical protein